MIHCKKLCLICVVLFLSANLCVGSDVLVGSKKGCNLSAFYGLKPPFPQKRRPLLGIDTGFWGAVPIGNRLMPQVELSVGTRGDKIVDSTEIVRRRLTYIDIPLLVQWNPGKRSLIKLLFPGLEELFNTWLYAGPRFSAAMCGVESHESAKTNTLIDVFTYPPDSYNDVDFSLVMGSEWEIPVQRFAVIIDLRYSVGFMPVDKADKNLRHSALSLLLGYSLRL